MDMIEISGLWLNTDSNGKQYFVGYMGSAKILIFKNGYKEHEKQPDYVLYLAKPQKQSASTESKQDDAVDF